MTVIVEFVGLPGSGKTTLRAELESALGESGIRILARGPEQYRRVQRKVRSLWLYRRAVLAATRALQHDSRPVAQRVRALRWLVATLELHHEAAKLEVPGAVLILGEGLAQRAMLAFVDAQSSQVSRHVGAYVSGIPKPDIIVHLRIDPIESVQRQQSRRLIEGKRGEQRVADRFDLAADQLLEAMRHADQLLSHVVKLLATEYGVEVISLDTSDLLAAVTDLRGRIVHQVIHRAR